jgi:protein tyrosine/serine phosphatase
MSEDTPHHRVTEFFEEYKTKWLRIGIYSWHGALSWRTQLEELMKIALELILNSDNYPLLISSTSTVHLCTIIGCFRKVQGWNLSSIMEEFRRFAPEQPISIYKNFVEVFDFDLINIPEHSPLKET